MNFNIKTFNINQLHKENNYIINNYFINLKGIYETEQIENNYFKCDAILYNISYTMYKLNTFYFDILLIPKDINTFKTDFNDIIIYRGNEKGLHFSILKRNNELVELITYNFITNDSGYVTANYRYNSLDDQNHKLQKELINNNYSHKSFIDTLNTCNLFHSSYKINRIKRNTKKKILNRVYGNSLLEAYDSFDKNS